MTQNYSQNEAHGDISMPVHVQRALGGISYPADKKKLIDTAKSNNADQETLDLLNSFPDKSYGGVTDVSKELSKHH